MNVDDFGKIIKERRRNICLIISYDGTAYHGFQRQSEPVLAVQNVLESRLPAIFGDDIRLWAAGRTDAGVHARGQVVNFFTDGAIPAENIPRASSSVLPPDIVALRAFDAPRDFSALHSALRKTYEYRILTGEPSPFERNFSWRVKSNLNVKKMESALKILLGTHDFSAFRAAGGAPMSPVRTMYGAGIYQDGALLKIKLTADGFLYHMARNIVGTLVRVGEGKLSEEGFAKIFASLDRKKAAPTAPARGLFLDKVEYDAPWMETTANKRT